MTTPPECRITESHEWTRREGDIVTIGITRYAVNELTDVTFVEMKPVSSAVAAGESLGEVESVKTASDVFTPVGGEIIEINDELGLKPSLLNSDPFGRGWLVKIRTTDPSPLDALMDSAAYDERFPV